MALERWSNPARSVLRAVLLAAIVAHSGLAHALGLGKLNVRSGLNEPLDAEIPVLSVTDKERPSLTAGLASRAEFASADIEFADALAAVKTEVVDKPGGVMVLKLTTDKPVTDPFLHFLVNVEWAGGRMQREYTALLDPPLYAESKPQAVTAPRVTPMPGPQAPQAQPLAPPAPGEPSLIGPPTVRQGASPVYAPGSEPPQPQPISGQIGPVKAGDTLWGIASGLRPQLGVGEFQIMLALLRENPQAFVDNNMNRLKRGATLNVPTREQIDAISRAEAASAYTAQLDAWQEYKVRLAGAARPVAQPAEAAEKAPATAGKTASSAGKPAAKTASAGTTAAAGEGTKESKDLLRIVQATVDAEKKAGAPAGKTDAAKAAAEAKGLRDRIGTLEEALTSGELENKELRERVRLLEEQVEKSNRLLQIESQNLALAQQQAAQAAEKLTAAEAAKAAAESKAALDAEQAAKSAAEAAQAAEAAKVAEAARVAAENAHAADAAKAAEAARVAAEAAKAAEAKRIADAARAAQAEEAARAAAQAAAARPAPPAQKTPANPPAAEKPKPKPKVVVEPIPVAETSILDTLMDVGGGLAIYALGGLAVVAIVLLGLWLWRRRRSIAEFEESILSGSALDSRPDTSEPLPKAGGSSDTSFLSDFGVPGMGTMHADEVDPVAEAEVYLAYGRSEQAEEVLKEAITRDPKRDELKLKLLDIYAQRNDVKAFETFAEEIYPADSGYSDLWVKVAMLGRKVSPNNPLFKAPSRSGAESTAPAAAAAAPAAADATLMLDMSGTPAAEGGHDEPFPMPEPEEGLELDLDDFVAEAEGDSGEAVDTGSLDFDIGEEELKFDDTHPSLELEDDTQPPRPAAAESFDKTLKVTAEQMRGLEDTAPPAPAAPTEPVSHAPDAGSIDFDTGELGDTPKAKAAADDEDALSFDDDLLLPPGTSEEDELTLEAPGGDEGDLLKWDTEGGAEPSLEGFGDFGTEQLDAGKTQGLDFAETTAPEDEGGNGGEAMQWDETATKLDLARAYIDMGDSDGARSILDEVLQEGNEAQKRQAQDLVSQIGA